MQRCKCIIQLQSYWIISRGIELYRLQRRLLAVKNAGYLLIIIIIFFFLKKDSLSTFCFFLSSSSSSSSGFVVYSSTFPFFSSLSFFIIFFYEFYGDVDPISRGSFFLMIFISVTLMSHLVSVRISFAWCCFCQSWNNPNIVTRRFAREWRLLQTIFHVLDVDLKDFCAV